MLDLLQRLSGLELLGLALVLGVVAISLLAVFMAFWRSLREAKVNAWLKRDMLARGMSVDDIERLTAPASVREAQIQAEMHVREAQINADLKRDLQARGLSVEEIQCLAAPPPSAVAATAGELAKSLASLPDAPAEEIEETLALLMTADPARQNAALDVVNELAANEVGYDVVLAAVRSLCRPTERPALAADTAANVFPRG
jgi:hypothetical protein